MVTTTSLPLPARRATSCRTVRSSSLRSPPPMMIRVPCLVSAFAGPRAGTRFLAFCAMVVLPSRCSPQKLLPPHQRDLSRPLPDALLVTLQPPPLPQAAPAGDPPHDPQGAPPQHQEVGVLARLEPPLA